MATILLVDDEKVARTVYGDYLTAAGHTVTCVGSVAEARAALGWIIVGGLGLALVSTLYLTPVAYLLLAGLSKPRAAEAARVEKELLDAL